MVLKCHINTTSCKHQPGTLPPYTKLVDIQQSKTAKDYPQVFTTEDNFAHFSTYLVKYSFIVSTFRQQHMLSMVLHINLDFSRTLYI